jgi:hypothetical protein
MSRNRQIYQSAALFVSPSPATGYMFSSGNSGENLLKQIPRIQSTSLSFNVARTDINEFSRTAAIDRIIINPPSSNLNFSYYPTNGYAESLLGFAAKGQGNFVSGLIDGSQGEKNYHLGIVPEGYDSINFSNTDQTNVISIGNGFISNYSVNFAVGQVTQATLSVEGANAQFDTGSAMKDTPAVDPTNGRSLTGVYYTLPTAIAHSGADIPSALRPGDIQIEFPDILGWDMSGANSINVTSVGISIPLTRNPIQRLGTPFPFTKVVQFPISATISVDALATEIRESKLSDVLCNDQSYNFRVKCLMPNCSGQGAEAMVWDVKGAKLDSQEYGLNIGDTAATIRLSYSAQIGAVNAMDDGIFLSGSY